MHQVSKYVWGSSCILYVLSVVSALILGYWAWWMLLAAVLGLATFTIWRFLGKAQPR